MKICPRCGKELEDNAIVCKYCSLGFGFGILWAGLAIMVGVLGILGPFIASTLLRAGPGLIEIIALAVISVILIVAGILVLKKRKLGLYIVFVLIPIDIISSFIALLTGGDFVWFLISFILGSLWLWYFYRRRYMFK
ncbi:MAG TPA: hypothetical protein VGB16_06200 [candidate division Zixibacteria bacterium]